MNSPVKPLEKIEVVHRELVLSQEECSTVRDTVYKHRKAWERKHEEAPFFVLGTPSYLYATEGRLDSYLERAQHYNQLLHNDLGWLYERVLVGLGNVMQGAIQYHATYSLPGFHIFLSDPVFEQSIASVHFDLQYSELDWSAFHTVDFSNPLSFTLSIVLPERGGGLYVWDAVRCGQTSGMEWDVKRTQKHFHPYKIGEMVCHSGKVLHQIAPSKDLTPDDVRLTLQGHGLCCDGVWQIYW